jgi:hypothetical protein
MKRPKHIRIFDNGGKTADRYTVVYLSMPDSRDIFHRQTFESLGMSAEPFHPQGVGMHGAAIPGSHLGKRIRWEQLPVDCQKAVLQDFQQ